MKAQTCLDESEDFLDALVNADAWIRKKKSAAGRARRWSKLIEAAHEAAQSGKLFIGFGDVPRVGYDHGTRQNLFVFTAPDGELVVVSEKGLEALTLV